MIIFAVLYWRDAFIHVAAEMLKITFTFSMLSCDWRDDQIRILQGNSVQPWNSLLHVFCKYLCTSQRTTRA